MELKWSDQDYYSTGEERHCYRAEIFSADLSWDGSSKEIPTGAVEFSQWFAELIQEIPVTLRNQAVLKLVGSNCDECSKHAAAFEVSVEREETDAEYEARRNKEITKAKADAARHAIAKEKADRAAYERLKAKYGE